VQLILVHALGVALCSRHSGHAIRVPLVVEQINAGLYGIHASVRLDKKCISYPCTDYRPDDLNFFDKATNWQFAGSSPAEVIELLKFPIPSSRNIPQALTQSEYQEYLLGVKAPPTHKVDNLTIMCQPSRKCGIPNMSQPSRPPRPLTGIALLYFNSRCFFPSHRVQVGSWIHWISGVLPCWVQLPP
jgi:hypothetical protein